MGQGSAEGDSSHHPRDVNFEIILKGHGADIDISFKEPIIIPTNVYEGKIGLKSFVTYNNIANVEENVNNRLRIKVPGSEKYETFSLETGIYEVASMNKQMQEFITRKHPKLKDIKENFNLIGNDATQKAEFIFKADGYGVDFNIQGSLHKLLGFKSDDKFENRGRYIAQKIVDIVKVTQLVFNTNITESNYINEHQVPFIYNCSIDVPAGYRLMREIDNVSYKTLTTNQISTIRVWITDQNGAPVDLRGDELLVTLSLKLEKLISKVEISGNGRQ